MVPADVPDAGTGKPEAATVVQDPAAVRLAQLRVVLPRVTAAQHTIARPDTAPGVNIRQKNCTRRHPESLSAGRCPAGQGAPLIQPIDWRARDAGICVTVLPDDQSHG